MTQPSIDDRYRRYRDALRKRVCAVCLDSRDDGSCGLASGRVCALEEHLPRVVDVLIRIKSGRMDEYAAALEAEVCSRCSQQDDHGACRLRTRGECALAVYLPIILDVIDEVAAQGSTHFLPEASPLPADSGFIPRPMSPSAPGPRPCPSIASENVRAEGHASPSALRVDALPDSDAVRRLLGSEAEVEPWWIEP